jgi:indolepyruvate ferredoxin oxidoreductase beta subunit
VNELNILIASVGGQGGVTLSRILAEAAVDAGYSVRTGETLGMAQRGGSVQSFVRIGKEVRSPLFPRDSADVLLALEASEAVRSFGYLKKGALVLVDPEIKETITTITKKEKFPSVDDMLKALGSRGARVHVVEARKEASRLGQVRSANVYMLGVLCGTSALLPLGSVEAAIRNVLGKRGDVAVEVFHAGLKAVASAGPA